MMPLIILVFPVPRYPYKHRRTFCPRRYESIYGDFILFFFQSNDGNLFYCFPGIVCLKNQWMTSVIETDLFHSCIRRTQASLRSLGISGLDSGGHKGGFGQM